MTDPSEWAGESSVASEQCLHEFYLFSQEMAKVYEDKNRQRVAVITLMQGYIQHRPESVRAYANCLNANWRQAGWNLQKTKEVLYDIACAGLCNTLKNKVGLITPAWGRFNTIEEFFDKTAASEVTHIESKKQQQQQQQQQKQPAN